MPHDHSHGGHSHDHGGLHHSHAPDNAPHWAFFIAIVANLAFTIIEAFYAYFAHSTSLLADAGHNLGDVLALTFAWIATLLLKKQASARYSYGLKKTSIVASLTNAIILLVTTAIIVREAIEKFVHPSHIVAKDVMIVAFIGIIINGATALLFMKGSKDDLNIKGAFLHLAYDALISLGVVIVAGVILFTNWEILDPIVGILIAIAILWGTWGLFRDSLKLILDGVPRNIDYEAVKKYLLSLPGVTDVHDLHIWGMSTKENALTTHLVMPGKMLSDDKRADIQAELKAHHNIDHITIQVEQGDGKTKCTDCAC